jgi:hypothetical protein
MDNSKRQLQNRFYLLVEYNIVDEVKRFIDRGLAFPHLDKNKALYLAVKGGHLDMVKYLLTFNKVDVKKNDFEVIYKAIEHKKIDILKYLFTLKKVKEYREPYRFVLKSVQELYLPVEILNFLLKQTESIPENFTQLIINNTITKTEHFQVLVKSNKIDFTKHYQLTIQRMMDYNINNIKVIKYFLSLDYDHFFNNSIFLKLFLMKGKLDIVKLYYKLPTIKDNLILNDSLEYAVQSSDLKLVKFLLNNTFMNNENIAKGFYNIKLMPNLKRHIKEATEMVKLFNKTEGFNAFNNNHSVLDYLSDEERYYPIINEIFKNKHKSFQKNNSGLVSSISSNYTHESEENKVFNLFIKDGRTRLDQNHNEALKRSIQSNNFKAFQILITNKKVIKGLYPELLKLAARLKNFKMLEILFTFKESTNNIKADNLKSLNNVIRKYKLEKNSKSF